MIQQSCGDDVALCRLPKNLAQTPGSFVLRSFAFSQSNYSLPILYTDTNLAAKVDQEKGGRRTVPGLRTSLSGAKLNRVRQIGTLPTARFCCCGDKSMLKIL